MSYTSSRVLIVMWLTFIVTTLAQSIVLIMLPTNTHPALIYLAGTIHGGFWLFLFKHRGVI